MASVPAAQAQGKVEGVDLQALHAGPSNSAAETEDKDKSVLVIGMRGAGKTHVGKLAAHALGKDWTFADADVLFEERHGALPAFVAAHGWRVDAGRYTVALRPDALSEGPTVAVALPARTIPAQHGPCGPDADAMCVGSR